MYRIYNGLPPGTAHEKEREYKEGANKAK